jgi:hypothetical protein
MLGFVLLKMRRSVSMPGNRDEADRQRIDRLRRELEAASPQSGEGDWDAAAELAEVEKLAEMGIVLKPRDESSSSRKGKGKAAPSGHVIFVDGREECESTTFTRDTTLTYSRAMGRRRRSTINEWSASRRDSRPRMGRPKTLQFKTKETPPHPRRI